MKHLLCGLLLVGAAAASSASPKRATVARPGIKTPGVQISFDGVTPEATLPDPDKTDWVFFMSSAPAGGGGGGRGARGGGRGNGAGAAAAASTPPGAAAGFVYIPASDSLLKIDTKTNKPADPIIGLKTPCGGAVSAFGSLWVPTCGDGSLQRIDPKTGKITATVASGAAPARHTIAASDDSIWLISDQKETLSRIDPDQNAVVGEIRIPAGCQGLTFGQSFLWAACPEENRILKINPATNVVDKRIEVAERPIAIAIAESSIWVLCAKEGKVDRIDPKTDKVTKTIELKVPGTQGDLAAGEGYLWVTMPGFPVTRIDTTAETAAQQFYGAGGGGIATGGGALWLSNTAAGTVTRIDPKLLLATLAD